MRAIIDLTVHGVMTAKWHSWLCGSVSFYCGLDLSNSAHFQAEPNAASTCILFGPYVTEDISAALFVLLPSQGRTFGGYLLCPEVVEFMVRAWFEFYGLKLFFASCCAGQTSDSCVYVCIYVQ